MKVPPLSLLSVVPGHVGFCVPTGQDSDHFRCIRRVRKWYWPFSLTWEQYGDLFRGTTDMGIVFRHTSPPTP